MESIEHFIQNYDQAVRAGDIHKIASHFHDRFVLSTPTNLWYLTNDAEFEENLKKSFDRYLALGAKECRMLTSTIHHFKSNHVMLDAQWGLIDDHGIPMINFDITYCIKLFENHWKYIFIIDHNEASQIKQYQMR